jgi:hypothetical protein
MLDRRTQPNMFDPEVRAQSTNEGQPLPPGPPQPSPDEQETAPPARAPRISGQDRPRAAHNATLRSTRQRSLTKSLVRRGSYALLSILLLLLVRIAGCGHGAHTRVVTRTLASTPPPVITPGPRPPITTVREPRRLLSHKQRRRGSGPQTSCLPHRPHATRPTKRVASPLVATVPVVPPQEVLAPPTGLLVPSPGQETESESESGPEFTFEN